MRVPFVEGTTITCLFSRFKSKIMSCGEYAALRLVENVLGLLPSPQEGRKINIPPSW